MTDISKSARTRTGVALNLKQILDHILEHFQLESTDIPTNVNQLFVTLQQCGLTYKEITGTGNTSLREFIRTHKHGTYYIATGCGYVSVVQGTLCNPTGIDLNKTCMYCTLITKNPA